MAGRAGNVYRSVKSLHDGQYEGAEVFPGVCRLAYFRLDRAASVHLFHPISRLAASTLTKIPVLMYHRIARIDAGTTNPYYRTDTDPAVFAEQVRFLSESGYKSIDLSNVTAILDAPPISERLVVITFDDGYHDFYREAFPILSKYGFSATVFLPTAYIGDSPRQFKSVDCLTWTQVRELQQAGITFGSHTVHHPQLRELKISDVELELRCSKEGMEQELGREVRSFSYPYAFPEADRGFTRDLRQLLCEAGYDNGVSTTVGIVNRKSDRLFMPRLPINSLDDPLLFRAKLEGGYDWLHTFQSVRKRIARVRQSL